MAWRASPPGALAPGSPLAGGVVTVVNFLPNFHAVGSFVSSPAYRALGPELK